MLMIYLLVDVTLLVLWPKETWNCRSVLDSALDTNDVEKEVVEKQTLRRTGIELGHVNW